MRDSDANSNMSNPGDSDELRMMESPPLPVTSARARTMEVVATENLHYQGFRLKKAGPTFGDRMRSVNWGPIVLALVIGLAGGAGLWSWRTTSAKRKTVAVVESPLDYHKRQFLAELRGAGSNAGSMQVRVDRMRFHQRVLISYGFLAEKKFVFTNGAAKAYLSVNRIDSGGMEYAMIEPRGKDVLAVIAPREDMPEWESVMRTAGGKKL